MRNRFKVKFPWWASQESRRACLRAIEKWIGYLEAHGIDINSLKDIHEFDGHVENMMKHADEIGNHDGITLIMECYVRDNWDAYYASKKSR